MVKYLKGNQFLFSKTNDLKNEQRFLQNDLSEDSIEIEYVNQSVTELKGSPLITYANQVPPQTTENISDQPINDNEDPINPIFIPSIISDIVEFAVTANGKKIFNNLSARYGGFSMLFLSMNRSTNEKFLNITKFFQNKDGEAKWENSVRLFMNVPSSSNYFDIFNSFAKTLKIKFLQIHKGWTTGIKENFLIRKIELDSHYKIFYQDKVEENLELLTHNLFDGKYSDEIFYDIKINLGNLLFLNDYNNYRYDSDGKYVQNLFKILFGLPKDLVENAPLTNIDDITKEFLKIPLNSDEIVLRICEIMKKIHHPPLINLTIEWILDQLIDTGNKKGFAKQFLDELLTHHPVKYWVLILDEYKYSNTISLTLSITLTLELFVLNMTKEATKIQMRLTGKNLQNLLKYNFQQLLEDTKKTDKYLSIDNYFSSVGLYDEQSLAKIHGHKHSNNMIKIIRQINILTRTMIDLKIMSLIDQSEISPDLKKQIATTLHSAKISLIQQKDAIFQEEYLMKGSMKSSSEQAKNRSVMFHVFDKNKKKRVEFYLESGNEKELHDESFSNTMDYSNWINQTMTSFSEIPTNEETRLVQADVICYF
ncbi:hypothetical protein SNEBB_007919 [Seison nebaliae]|nr:hypothetical protein SNEBB_007919 [Seison nebaliae]